MSAPVMLEPARSLLGRAFRYGLAGLFATAIYFGLVAGQVEWAKADAVLASAVGSVIVTVISYVLNRRWVFDTALSHTSVFSRFVAASVLSLALNTAIMYLAVNILGWPYQAGLALTVAIIPPTNFVINYFWCFSRQ